MIAPADAEGEFDVEMLLLLEIIVGACAGEDDDESDAVTEPEMEALLLFGGGSVDERLSDCDTAPVRLTDCDCVALLNKLFELDGVGLARRDGEKLPVQLPDVVGVPLPVGEGETLSEGSADNEARRVADAVNVRLRVCMTDAVALGEADSELLTELLLAPLAVALAVGEGDIEADRLADADADELAATLRLIVADADTEGVAVSDGDIDSVTDGEEEPAWLAVAALDAPYERDGEDVGGTDVDGVSDGVVDGLCEGDGSHWQHALRP